MKMLRRDTTWEGLDAGLESYLNIASSFTSAVGRVWEAEAAIAKLELALREFHTCGQLHLDAPSSAVLRQLARVPAKSLESLEHVTNISHLVYAATLFDTFLTETTQFLFLSNPRAMGADQQIPLSGLLDASSRNVAITNAAFERARQVGELPFARRLQFVQETCGIKIVLPDAAWEAMNHFSSVSGSATHDHQGGIHLQLDDRGEIVIRPQSCPRHQAKISREDVRWAIESYEQAARATAAAVFSQILHQEDHPAVQLFLKGSTLKLELHPS
jgi:hypothetical protein